MRKKKREDGKGKERHGNRNGFAERIHGEKSPGAVDPHPGLFLPEHLGGLKVSSRIRSYCCCRIHSRCCSIRRSRTEESERASSRNCSHCCCFRIPPQQERRSRIQIILQPLFPNRLLLETLHPLSQPQPLSHPHPQFVAAKSLMFVPQRNHFALQFMI